MSSTHSTHSTGSSVAYIHQWKNVDKVSTPVVKESFYEVGGIKRESYSLSYSFDKAISKPTTSTATQVVSVSVRQNEHLASEHSDPEDWSDADDDDHKTDHSWFFRPAPIPIPVHKPLYVPSRSYHEHQQLMKRYTPYHKTCYYKK